MFVPLKRARARACQPRLRFADGAIPRLDGTPNDWHFVHYAERAKGGAGLVFTEMTCVSAQGRISPGCTGLYSDEHERAWKRLVDFVHAETEAKIAIQLGHSGLKGSTQLGWETSDAPLLTDNWEVIGPSQVPWSPDNQTPREMTRADMDRVRDEFVRSADMAERAGFDWLELHYAHGYLMSSFITPLTNKRTDEYGGSLENRMRFPLEVYRAVRKAWPDDKPISVRISAHDWVGADGIMPQDAVAISRLLAEEGVDLIDVSAGQTTVEAQPVYGRMFQTPFSDRIRNEVGIATLAVGNIYEPDHVNSILMAGRADLVCLGAAASRRSLLDAARGRRSQVPGRDLAEALSARARPALPPEGARRDHVGEGVMGALTGRHALITGGGSGIGAAIARAFAAEGAAVSLAGRRMQPLQEVARGLRATAIAADVSREPDCAAMAEAARAAFGPVDIVVANAGLAESAPIAKTTLAQWRRIMDVKLTGAFLTVRAVLPDIMREGAGGRPRRIIFMASVAALRGWRLYRRLYREPSTACSASRARWRPSSIRRCVTVNAVCPGYTDTPLVDAAVGENRRQDRPPGRRGARRARPRQRKRPLHHAGGGRADSAVAVLAGGDGDHRPGHYRSGGAMSRELSSRARRRARARQRLRLWLRLLRTARAIEAELRERLRSTFGVTLPQFDVMARSGAHRGRHDHDRAVALPDGVERQRHRHHRPAGGGKAGDAAASPPATAAPSWCG